MPYKTVCGIVSHLTTLLIQSPGRQTSLDVVSIIQYMLSGTHLLEQYLKAPQLSHWQFFNLGVNTHLFHLTH